MPRYSLGATPKSTGDNDQYKRVTVNLTAGLHERLFEAAAKKGMTMTELLRQALGLQLYLIEHDINDVEVRSSSDSPPEKLVML